MIRNILFAAILALGATSAQAASCLGHLADISASRSCAVEPSHADGFHPAAAFGGPGVLNSSPDFAVGVLSAPGMGAAAVAPSGPAISAPGVANAVSLPEPAAWAMMLAGFGLAGAALRHGRAYRLVEIAADGAETTETFRAKDDQRALAQALGVAEGVALELWRDENLVLRQALTDAQPN